MTIISTGFVVTLLVIVSAASLAALVLMGVVLGNRLAFHHRARTARYESIRAYYGHLALGH
jgi:uncharacterized membrane protein YraQ (UPF0718 family)